MNESDHRVRQYLTVVAETYRPDVDDHLAAAMSGGSGRGGGGAPRRVLVAVLALAVAAAGIALAVRTLLPHGGSGTPAGDPSLGPIGSGGSIAVTVTSVPGYNSDIWAMDGDGSDPRPVVTGPDDVRDAALSRDGSMLAFVRTEPVPHGEVIEGTTCDQIFVVHSDGTGLRALTDCRQQDEGPTWSPDGTKVAFWSNRKGGFNIWVVNADGTGMTQLTSGDRSDSSPAWSPDGTQIAFASSAGPGRGEDIYLVNANGSGLTQLTGAPAYEENPAWSPDGTRIAFTRGDDFAWDVWVMNADGSDQKPLTDYAGWDGHPVWSPDGSEIAFASDRGFTPEQRKENERNGAMRLGAVYLMDADGSNVRRLTDDRFDVAYPASWAPGR